MKIPGNAIVTLTALACLLALGISIYPGVLNDLLIVAIFLPILVVPIAAFVALIGLIITRRIGKLRGLSIPRRRLAIALAILISTVVLLQFYVPRRLAFAASRAAFEQMIPSAALSESRGASLKRRLGVYTVDEYAADPRGGVYFRVYSGMDGIGPDRMSYGFAHKPNRNGTPFGASNYQLFRLGQDWYWFCASDDWY